jgi:hypothetical protein
MTFQVPAFPHSKLPRDSLVLWCEQDETLVAHACPWTVLKELPWWERFVLRKGENGFIAYMEDVCASDPEWSLGLYVLLAPRRHDVLWVSTCAQYTLKGLTPSREGGTTVSPQEVVIENLIVHMNNRVAFCTLLQSAWGQECS